jgi:hypothetical protein
MNQNTVFDDEYLSPQELQVDWQLQLQIELAARKQAEQIRDAVYRISKAVHSAENLPGLFRLIQTIASELMPAEGFYIALFEATTGLVHFPHFVDSYDDLAPKIRAGG